MNPENILNKVLTIAFEDARNNKHEYVTPEHMLYASLFFDESMDVLENSGVNTEKLKKELLMYFNEYINKIENVEPIESMGVHEIIFFLKQHLLSAGKTIVNAGDLIIAIYDLEESHASYFLKQQGMRRIDLLNYVAHGVSVYDQLEEEEHLEEFFEREEQEEKENLQNDRKKENISNFFIELTEKAQRGEIDPLIGREEILKRTIQVLSRRQKNNPIHVGDPGVGKTAITEGLARMIIEGKVPKILKNSKIYSIDMGAMLAGTKYRGDFEERFKKVLTEIKKRENSIIYIDEIHTVVGAGAVSGGSMDASNILKPFLTDGKLKFIGSTTYEEYKKTFEKDRALSRRFQKIDITEPTVEETYKILIGLKTMYEDYHNVIYSDKVLKLAAELSGKYINDRHLPDKAIDVIDETGAFVRLNSNDDDRKIKITEADIEQTVSIIAKVPKKSVSGSEISNLKNLEEDLRKEIYGQEKAIEIIVKAIKRSRAGFDEGEKPVASLLFVGPTGVGKTEVARQLSKTMGIPLLRFDMSEYQEKHTVARLIGAPPGYVGYEEGGLLTDAIKKTPYCVLLFDEIEKAHQDIYNVLLQVMDYGTLTDNNGKKADFKNVIFIMTSNAGAREIGKTLIGFENSMIDKSILKKAVDKIFSPEFRNRLDEIVGFNGINMNMAYLIAKKAIEKFEIKLKSKNISIKVSEECLNWIANKGFSSEYGAREILRVVQDEIKSYFVDEVLFGKLSKGGSAKIDIVENLVSVRIVNS